MKLSIITAVVLRLFAIYWAFAGVIGILTALGSIQYMGMSGALEMLRYSMPFIVPVIYGVFALLAWRFAESISQCAVGKTDPTLEFNQITAENFYTLGIFIMGLYYFLGHIAPMVNWLHYIVITRAGDAIIHQQHGLSLYQVSSQVLPCIAGAIVAMMAAKLGKRLSETGSILGRGPSQPSADSPRDPGFPPPP